MFVTSLEATVWVEDGHESQTAEQPSWDDVLRAVQRLDGERCDGLILNGPNGAYLGIVGGQGGKYVVAGKGRDGEAFILTVGQHQGRWIALNVGGQENEYADNEVAGLEDVLAVARTFFESGDCDRQFHWKDKAAKISPGFGRRAGAGKS
jgi:hypothetical protein